MAWPKYDILNYSFVLDVFQVELMWDRNVGKIILLGVYDLNCLLLSFSRLLTHLAGPYMRNYIP